MRIFHVFWWSLGEKNRKKVSFYGVCMYVRPKLTFVSFYFCFFCTFPLWGEKKTPPSLWTRLRRWHSLEVCCLSSESCHFSSALESRRYCRLQYEYLNRVSGKKGTYKSLLEYKRQTHQPSESFPRAQDERQRPQCAPEIWMVISLTNKGCSLEIDECSAMVL